MEPSPGSEGRQSAPAAGSPSGFRVLSRLGGSPLVIAVPTGRATKRLGAPRRAPPPAPQGAGPTAESLYRTYRGYVAAIVARRWPADADDEVGDLVQEVFVHAMRALPSLRNPEAVRRWLARIALWRVAKRLASWQRRRTESLEAGAAAEVPSRLFGPEDRAIAHNAFEELEKIPLAQRTAWTLRYLEDEPLEAVARACGCSLTTAKRWIARAHKALRPLAR